jgi:hypothetical protein
MVVIMRLAVSLLGFGDHGSQGADRSGAVFSQREGKRFSMVDAGSSSLDKEPKAPEWYHVTSVAREGTMVPPWPPMYDSWISTNHEQVVFFLGGAGGGPDKPEWNVSGSALPVSTFA